MFSWRNKYIRIHHECQCRTGKSHLRGTSFSQRQGLPRFPYHARTGSLWILFFPTFGEIVPRTSGLNGGLQWSCEIEVSHMSKELISSLQKHAYSNILKILPPKNEKFSDKKFSYFSYFCSKHRLWVLVRTASTRRL